MYTECGVTQEDVCLVVFIGLTELHYERYRVWTGSVMNLHTKSSVRTLVSWEQVC